MNTIQVPAALLQYLRHQRLIMDYMYISAASVFIHDYFLTLHLEVKLIWFARQSYTKFIFLALRYSPFIALFFAIRNQSSSDLSVDECKATYPVGPWLVVFEITLAEIILSIRTWAVCGKSKVVGVLLVAVTTTSLVIQCTLMQDYIRSFDYMSPPYPGFRGCFVITSNRTLWKNYIAQTAVEAIFLAFMAFSALQSYIQGRTGKLTFMIHKDGILSYFYLMCISASNIVATILLPLDMVILLSPLQFVIHSVLAARIILNIRQVFDQGLQTELHTRYESLQFEAISV